jgi:MFS family permease
MCARGNKKYEPLPFRGVKGHHSDRSLSLEEEEDYDFVLHEGNTRTVSASRIHASDQPTVASILARPETRKCLSIQWMYSFVSLTVDETFPLFCLSQTAGFGLSELSIGRILSLCGLIFAFCQYWVNALIYNRFGLYGSIRIASLLSGPIMFLAPLSVLLNLGAGSGELHKGTFLFLALMMATYRIFTLVFFSNISVATNRTVPASERATMNGISVLGGSAAKALGPTFAGILVSSSVYWLGRFASLLIFGTIGLLGLFVSVLAFFFLRMDEDSLRIASTTEIIDLEEPCTIELPGGPHKQ